MYWRIGSFQELEHLSDKERRRILRQHAGWRTMARIIIISIVQGFLLGCCVGVVMIRELLMSHKFAGGIAGFSMLAGMVVSYQILLTRIRGQLLMYIEKKAREQRLPLCLKCGYNLKGLTGNICPECGERI